MIYKIMQLSSTSSNVDYWTFIKVDDTSTTIFTATILDDVETKLKSLMTTIPISKLKVVTEISFTDDLIFT